jgi:hypothetical protein
MNTKTMKTAIRYIHSAVISAALIGLVGCAAGGMKNVNKSGFLGNYSQLKPGTGDQAALVYVKPGVDFKRYKKIMFERVTVSLAPTSKKREIDPAMLNQLTNYYQKALVDAVKDGYQVVDKPGPDVLWVRAAITDVVPSNPTSNTLSSIIPIGIVVSATAKATTDANLGTGEAATEIEILDSVTKERLAAAVDRRQGGKAAFRGKWVDTQNAFDHWAKRFRVRLDELSK